MNIEVFLTETEIAQEFDESIDARDLPEKFSYWAPHSASAWQDYSKSAVFAGLKQLWTEIAGRADRLTVYFGASIPIISLGAGDGLTDLPLLRALESTGKHVHYYPVDASQTLLEINCSQAEDSDFAVTGLKADISSPMHLVLAADMCESPKLFLLSGNTLGGFDPLDQLRQIAECMHKGDLLLLDAELHSDQPTGADHSPLAQQFCMATLRGLGVAQDDGEIRLENRKDDRHSGIRFTARRFHAAHDFRVHVSGNDTLVTKGEQIFLNFRYTFTPASFKWLLESHAGLIAENVDLSADSKFISALCSKK